MDVLTVSFVVNMEQCSDSNCLLLTSMNWIPTPNCSLLYLHSNDMNSLKSVFLGKNNKSVGISK